MSPRVWKLPACLSFSTSRKQTMTRLENTSAARTCLPVCLLAINLATQPWIINAAIYPPARPAHSQEREWATSWWCGWESVAMPPRVSPAGLSGGGSWLVRLSIKLQTCCWWVSGTKPASFSSQLIVFLFCPSLLFNKYQKDGCKQKQQRE